MANTLSTHANGHVNLFDATKETRELVLYSAAIFLVPFLSTNQLIVGTIVNAFLIKSAITYKTRNVFLLSLLPSIAALSAGLIFGSSSPQLLFMLPFIWAGNFLLMFASRKLYVHKKENYYFATFIGATAKTLFLFLAAATLLSQALVPAAFLTAFGVIQFITAESGAVLVAFAGFISKKISK